MDKINTMQETVIGYIFWSLFHGLGPMIWFYPLNELDITGYEAFVLVVFTPALWLCKNRSSVQSILQIKLIEISLLLFMLGGIASFQAATTLHRLIFLSLGTGAAFLRQSLTWWSEDEEERIQSFWGYTLSYFILLVSRIWYNSITPTWSDNFSNSVILAIFSLVIISKCFPGILSSKSANSVKFLGKSDNMKVTSSSTVSQSKVSEEHTTMKKNTDRSLIRERTSSLLSGVALGAICFVIHGVLGETSILIRFVVQGHPYTGPSPNPWGGFILMMMLVGLLISFHTNLPVQQYWSVVGFLSSVGLMFLPSWAGFICGCIFATYVMSVWPVVASHAVSCWSPGVCLLLSNSVYLLGVFGMVWCTAYNFVPFGGEMARERTYVLICGATALIAMSVTRKQTPASQLQIRLELPALEPTTELQPPLKKDNIFIRKFLFVLVFLGLLGFEYRKFVMPQTNFRLQTEKQEEFSALIWTFHFGYDNRGWPSFERAAEVLNDSGADVITLLESDASKPYLGNNDIAMWLGERLGMYTDFGPSTRDHTWGNLLLSKHPIINSTHHLLPSPEGELAPAIFATINITGSLVNFLVTHMGNDRDNLDRQLQATRLAELADQSEHPVVFLGYVTSAPGSRDYKKLTGKGRLVDIDPTDRNRWCEYIMYRDLTRLGYARISHGGLSDTELQMARWKLRNHDKPSDTPPYRFNPVFGERYHGHWYGPGHHFHMGTPKYFDP